MIQADMNIELYPAEHVAGAVMTAFVPKKNPFYTGATFTCITLKSLWL
jgi:hypothetical protein